MIWLNQMGITLQLYSFKYTVFWFLALVQGCVSSRFLVDREFKPPLGGFIGFCWILSFKHKTPPRPPTKELSTLAISEWKQWLLFFDKFKRFHATTYSSGMGSPFSGGISPPAPRRQCWTIVRLCRTSSLKTIQSTPFTYTYMYYIKNKLSLVFFMYFESSTESSV